MSAGSPEHENDTPLGKEPVVGSTSTVKSMDWPAVTGALAGAAPIEKSNAGPSTVKLIGVVWVNDPDVAPIVML